MGHVFGRLVPGEVVFGRRHSHVPELAYHDQAGIDLYLLVI